MAVGEFELIERYFARRAAQMRAPHVALGIGDDAALLDIPAGMQLAVSVDTLVSGVHFPAGAEPYDIGYKALAVSLSDMAAMGAEPLAATLALTLPQADESWLQRFSDGFFDLAARCRVALIGGDTTRGPLTISVQVHGLIPQGAALRRSGARADDDIYVTGTLGDGGLGLLVLQDKITLPAPQRALDKLNRPVPRVQEGMALRGIASSAIDISDGLLADLGHILKASGAGARLNVDALPVSSDVRSRGEDQAYALALGAGDDYELCFTVPASGKQALQRAFETLSCACTRVGVIEAEPGLRCTRADGAIYTPKFSGYEHFR